MVRYLTILTVLIICAGELAAQDEGLARAEALARQGSELERQGRYDEAIPLTKEALTIRETALGADHPDVAKSLNNLAALYVRKGRFAEAEPLYRRAIRIVEQARGPDDPDIASILGNLGELYQSQSLYSEAETMLRRSLAIREQAFGADNPETARSLNNLATLFFAQGRFSETEALFERSLAIWQKALGPDHPEVATALNNLGVLYNDQGRYDKAESAYRRSLEISEKALGSEHPTIADIANNLAQVYAAQARYGEAEPLLKRSLAIREISLGPTHPKVAESLNNIAQLYYGRGRDAEAEPLFRRSLAIYEGALGPNHPDIAMSLGNLAAVYVSQGRSDQAEPLFRRSLEIREKALGPNHPDVALNLNNLATIYETQQRRSEAEPLYRRSVAIWEKAYGPDHPDLGRGLNNLAKLYFAERRFEDAEALFKRSLSLFESIFGTEHPMVALSLNNLAVLYNDTGRYAEAEPLFKRCLAIYTKEFGHEHYDNVQAMWNLAAIYRQQQRIAEAYSLSAEAVDIVAHRISAAESARSDTSRAGDQRKFRELFLLNVVLEYEHNARSLPIGFQVAQLAKASTAAKAVAGMAARFAAGSDALAMGVRERQDLVRRWQTLDSAIVNAASKPPVQRDAAAEAALRSQFGETGMKIDALDSRIAREFPAYAELSNPKPLELPDAQGLLAADEAMLVYLVGGNQSWVWVLRRDKAELHPIAIGDKALATEVSALRERLDPERNPDLAPFAATRAHALYEKLMAPAAPLLQGATQIFVVLDGALESLPLSVLITRAPVADPETLADHRDLAWLARDYAVTVLPSVGALRGLRQLAQANHADEPFIGIGNPVLNGTPDQTRGIKSGQLFRAAGANVEAIRALPPLPETEDELRTVAKALGAHEQDLYLAERASEPLIRVARLDRYRIVEFATHGLISGDLPGLAEPALVLTPPNVATPDNDGLLTASKIATLKLNADWVVLSACNTAAGDGTPDAGGLSGLAKAFFYSGARSVLVSHWSVPSKAAVQLITAAFERLEQEPKIGRAEALRRAEIAMLDPQNPPEFAHPLAWAPFVLAGEGGAGR